MIRRFLTDVASYLRNPNALPDETARSISDEIQFHLEQSVREGMEDGLSEQESRKQALARFGSVESTFRGCASGAAEGHVRCHRAHLAITAALLVAVGSLATWLVLRPPAPEADLLLTGDIEGRVLDENSHPIEGAYVLAVVKTWPDGGYRQQAHTSMSGIDGRFLIPDVCPDDDEYEVQLAVLTTGRTMNSMYFARQRGPLKPTEFQLDRSALLAVRFETDQGEPLRGVEVFPFQRVQQSGTEDQVYFCSAKPIVRQSDRTGQVSLPYFAPGDQATIYLRAPGGNWSTQEFVVNEPEQVVVIKMPTAADTADLAESKHPQ